jgi:putative transposase
VADRARIFDDAAVAAIVRSAWLDLPAHHRDVVLDEFVVMPNHVHGILFIEDPDGTRGGARAQQAAPLPRRLRVDAGSLGAVVRSFKSRASREINAHRGTPGAAVWQRNYYERIIRDEHGLQAMRQYIVDNPARWAFDGDNPEGVPDAAEIAFWRQ